MNLRNDALSLALEIITPIYSAILENCKNRCNNMERHNHRDNFFSILRYHIPVRKNHVSRMDLAEKPRGEIFIPTPDRRGSSPPTFEPFVNYASKFRSVAS